MAKTPRELNTEARQTHTRAPAPETLDADHAKSGAAISQPAEPFEDYSRSFRADARYKEQPDAVPSDVDKSIGGVRPKKTGRRYRVV